MTLFNPSKSLVLALVILLSGCQLLPPALKSPQNQLELLQEQHRYVEALALLNELDPAEPANTLLIEQRPDLEKALDLFVKDALSASAQQLNEQQWPAAIATLSAALERNPGQPRLVKQLDDYTRLRNEKIHQLRLNLATVQAAELPRSIELLQLLQQLDPDNPQVNAQLLHQQQLASAHQLLLQNDAAQLMQAQQWAAAKARLQLAATLGDNQSLEPMLQETNAKLAAIAKKASRNANQQQQKDRNQQIEQLKKALEDNLLNAAVDLGNHLKEWRNDPEVRTVLLELKRKIEQKVAELTASGQEAYSKGLLDDAIAAWSFALSLDPENTDLIERLQRANRFKANFDKLRQSSEN